MAIQKRIFSYVPVDIDRSELMTIIEAARMLGISHTAVIARAERGGLTFFEDTDAPERQGRRLVLRSEIEQLKAGAGDRHG